MFKLKEEMTGAGMVPGMGSAVPPQPGTTGSGDKWSNTINGKPYTQASPKKKKKIVKKVEEDQVNPYDKLGMAMLKKAGVASPFKKKKSKGNQNAMKQQKFEHKIITLDEFIKKINENK